jgi:hypothetical protein
LELRRIYQTLSDEAFETVSVKTNITEEFI